MKKYVVSILTLVVLFGTMSGNVSYATQDEGTSGANAKREISGAPGFVPYRQYQLVRWGENGPNPTGGNLSAGDVVVWDCVSDDGVTIALVGATNSVDAVAGVVVSTRIQSVEVTGTTPGVDYGRRNWGYIQVSGFSNKVNVINGPTIAGGALVASATARNATAATLAPSGSVGTQRVMGFAYDANESGTGQDVGISL